MLEKLRQSFRSGLGLPDDANVDELVYNTIDEWDSVAHMQLVAEIEETFDLMLDTDEIIDMSSFGKARQILEEHGIEFE